MVKITLEFPTVDLAIVALGKLVPAGKVASGGGSQAAQPATLVPAGATTTVSVPRKGRSDKGQPRKQPTEQTTPVTPPESTPPKGLDVPPTEPAVPVASAEPPKLEEAQAALTELFNKKGAQTAMDLLARYGKSRLSEVPAEDRARLITEAKGLLGE